MYILDQLTAPNPLLRGARCRCVVCGKSFNSPSAFDRHRKGDYGDGGRHRRCLTWQELRAMGWKVNGAGFWIERQRIDRAPVSVERTRPAPTVSMGAL